MIYKKTPHRERLIISGILTPKMYFVALSGLIWAKEGIF